MTSSKDIAYYDIQNIVSDFLKTIFVDNFFFETTSKKPNYAHSGKVASIVVRGKSLSNLRNTSKYCQTFDINDRV